MAISESQSVQLRMRIAQAEDESFLFNLFAESQDHLAALRSNEIVWRRLVELQYQGRQISYEARTPEAENLLLLDPQGSPLGRILVDRRPHRWRIVDLALMPAWRGRGIGTQVLREYQRQAATAGASLELQVTPLNPARRLYERMGFRAVSEDAQAVEMVWNKPGF
jgi:ribosomal protein S18 acetylase RimI-like enzyme